MSKNLNEIETKEIAKAPEKRENYENLVKCGVAWIRKSQKGVYFLSGNLGNNCNLMIYPVANKLYPEQKDYNVSISGTKKDDNLFKVGGLDRFKDGDSIWFHGYIFNVEFYAKKNPYKENEQPDYILYFGKELETFKKSLVSYEEFENSFA